MDLQKEALYAMALTRICNFGFASANSLYKALGSATAVYEHRLDIRDVVPECSARLAEALLLWEEPLARADAEVEFCLRRGIKMLTPNDAGYPQRLTECGDAPLVLYYQGSAPLNVRKVVSIVGTRHCTAYGQGLINKFLHDLKLLCPEVLVLSGLAYGVDICAHRAALAEDFPTVGVLAHGLDRLYPSAHRETANQMVAQGGLLTEFMTGTNPDKANFVRRNRIVAGAADAVVLVESAAKGGGLITTSIARSYGREVLAFPGPVGAPYSEGCNNAIRNREATLITGADDFVKTMGWDDDERLRQAQSLGIERVLFPQLSDDEQRVVNLLGKDNDLQLNVIAMRTALPVSQLTALLFQLEMKGIVKPYAGGVYHLLS